MTVHVCVCVWGSPCSKLTALPLPLLLFLSMNSFSSSPSVSLSRARLLRIRWHKLQSKCWVGSRRPFDLPAFSCLFLFFSLSLSSPWGDGVRHPCQLWPRSFSFFFYKWTWTSDDVEMKERCWSVLLMMISGTFLINFLLYSFFLSFNLFISPRGHYRGISFLGSRFY